MTGLWTLECPNKGIFEGKCKYEKTKKGFVLRCPTGLRTFKAPNKDTCEAEVAAHNRNPRKFLPHGLTKCERDNPDVKRVLARCVKALTPKEGNKAVTICRKNIGCPL